MDLNLVMACLGIMGKGMVGIFVVVLVIWGCVALLNRIGAQKNNNDPTAM